MFVLVVIVYLGLGPTLDEKERVVSMQEFSSKENCEFVASTLNAEVRVARGQRNWRAEYRVFNASCFKK